MGKYVNGDYQSVNLLSLFKVIKYLCANELRVC